MIQDVRVLRDEFIPREVCHRDQEMNALTRSLDPVTWGDPADTTLLFGPSGSGKTCLARFALDRLREVTSVATQYVNCWQDYTRFRALYRALEGVEATVSVRESLSTDELLERLDDYDGPPFIVILDEVDQLHDDGVLADLYRTRGVSMILIANREDELFTQLDSRLVSRLRGCASVRFERYELDELVAILEDRVRWGLDERAISHEQLERIADAAAGDARVAINILRTAAQHAEADSVGHITDAVIDGGIPKGRDSVRQKHRDQLQPHQRTVYEIVRENDGIAPSTLYERYREQVEEPRSDRTVRNYLSKLAHYNLVVKKGEGRGRTYRVPE